MATITAGSPSRADVEEAFIAIGPGAHTVILPTGTGIGWTSPLTVPAGVTVQGSGFSDNGDVSDPTGYTWGTVIQDAATSSSHPCVFRLGEGCRVTQIKFEMDPVVDASGRSTYAQGMLEMTGGKSGMRVDRCHFKLLRRRSFTWNANWGLVDHNWFEQRAGAQVCYNRMLSWGGGTNGDASWAAEYEWGNPYHALYIEHNVVQCVSGGSGHDGDGGLRVVLRYNRWGASVVVHGTESSRPFRGGKVCEVYGNDATGAVGSSGQWVSLRSGSGVVWGNSVNSSVHPTLIKAWDERANRPFPLIPIGDGSVWHQIDGKSPWDVNEPGGPFYSGVCTSAGTLTMTDSTASFPDLTDSGFLYCLHNLDRVYTGTTTTTETPAGYITANTATQITFSNDAAFEGLNMTFRPGDRYEIWRVNQSMDQVGTIQGDLINRSAPAWPNQAVEPVYHWDNVYQDDSPATGFSNNLYRNIVNGVHIKNEERPGYTHYVPLYHPLATELLTTSGPVISGNPASQTKTVGDSVTFTVSAYGNPSPTYQWRKDGTPISGETSSSLTIASVQLTDAGSYDCVATNSEGTATSSAAVLTVNPAPTEGQPNTYAKKKIRGKRLRDSLVAAAAVTSTVVSYQGFDLTFDGDWQTGTFVTGEPYIVIPSSATLTAISPGVVESGGVTRNGTQINLTVATAGNHGLDSRLGMGHVYDADLNIGLQLPYTISSACTIVTSLSHVADAAKVNDEQQLEKVAFFTVLQSAPAAGSFRPAPYGTDKTVSFNTSSINWSLLLNLDDEADLPSIATLLDQAEHPYVRVKSNWEAQFLNQSSAGSLYGNVAARRLGDVLGRLNTNHTQGEKAPLLYATIQQAIDWYAGLEAGMSFPADGGHNCGHKAYMVFAGSILNHSGMLAYGAGTGATSKFQEDHQHFTISQDDIDQTFYNQTLRDTTYAANEDYIQSQLGTHEWGIRHTTEPHRDDNRWVAYRHVTGGPMFSIAVMIHLMGDTLKWNNLNFFSYNFDRFYGGTDVGVGAGANNIRTWAANRYLAHIA